MIHGIVKLGVAVPKVHVASPDKNADEIISLVHEAAGQGVKILTFPELCVSAYTCGDLFLCDSLIRQCEKALFRIAAETADADVLFFVGLPVKAGGKLYDCAAAVSRGDVLGLVPKKHLQNYGEADEVRYFASAPDKVSVVTLGYSAVMFGSKLLFECADIPELTVGCEIGADMYAPVSPAATLAGAGATVIVNLNASSEIVGREKYRRSVIESASGRLVCAYAMAGAGELESTTDLVFAGHSVIAECGSVKCERAPFADEDIVCANVDVAHIAHDRLKNNTVAAYDDAEYVKCPFSLDVTETDIIGDVDPTPFIPKGDERDAVLARILELQSRGLAKRLTAAYAKSAVIGISGGLDSCLALLVAVRAMKLLSRPTSDILAVTMPCFGTTSRTRSNAEKLCDELGTQFREVDIAESVAVHFRDIGHDKDDHSVVFENSQARERTQIIMDIANGNGGIVVGTGDLSELALGWATYNGDHMSNYGVNAGVPKTLVRHLVAFCADEAEVEGNAALADVLRDILATPVSPELLPPKEDEIAQKTEDIVGPYELHDFFLYRFVRYGEEPEKIFRVARAAFDGVYSDEIIAGWLKVFMRRFFTQQFKRSALPDGVKVGSVALSPRGDWRMPSDAEPWNVEL